MGGRGAENARMENATPNRKGGKCETGTCCIILQGWKTRDRFAWAEKRETGKRGNDKVWKA